MRGEGSDIAFTTLARLCKFGPDHCRDCGIYSIIPVYPVPCAVAIARAAEWTNTLLTAAVVASVGGYYKSILMATHLWATLHRHCARGSRDVPSFSPF